MLHGGRTCFNQPFTTYELLEIFFFVQQEILISLCIALMYFLEIIPLRLNCIINKYPTYIFIGQLIIFNREKNTNIGVFFLHGSRQMKVTDEYAN